MTNNVADQNQQKAFKPINEGKQEQNNQTHMQKITKKW